jgi:hypothetical protein
LGATQRISSKERAPKVHDGAGRDDAVESEVGFRGVYARGVWMVEIWPLGFVEVGDGR